MFIGENWKDIAKGNTAFIIAGGPSVKNIEDNKLKELIKNNFTITVNYNIEFYDDISMYITSDNRIARQFFEDVAVTLVDMNLQSYPCPECLAHGKKDSVLGPLNVIEAIQRYESKSIHMHKNPDMIKVIIGQTESVLNEPINGGQLHLSRGYYYTKHFDNLFLMNEYKESAAYSPFGVTGPKLHKDWEDIWAIYGNMNNSKIHLDGTDVFQARPGGNIMSQVLQLLYFMGFDKVITTGWGDGGDSQGSTDNFVWSDEELDSIPVHNKMWGDRLKILSGGEILKENGEFEDASFDELSNNLNKKNELIEKIYDTANKK